MKNMTRLSAPSSIMKADRRQRGSILVFLIVLMTVLTALGVGMVSMFGSSVLGVFSTNSVRRANYMAESGLRYAISEVRNKPDKEQALRDIDPAPTDPGYIDGNGKWFNVFPGVARYRVRVYPSWSKPAAGATNTTSFSANVANSGFPLGYDIPGKGATGMACLKVGQNNRIGITDVVIAADRKTVTYNLISNPNCVGSGTTPPITQNVTIRSGDYVNLAFPTTNTSSLPITKGSTLSVNINAVNIDALSAIIPLKNGQFFDDTAGALYSYQTARLVAGLPSTVQLEGINWRQTDTPRNFSANTYLVFSQAARLDATGDVAGGYIQTQKVLNDSLSLFSSGSPLPPPAPNQTPNALPDVMSGFTGNLDALDLTKSGDRVVVQGYIATGGTHAYWAAFQRLGEALYRFEDPEESGRYIGFHVAPISDGISDNLRNFWMQYHTLSYDVQIKNGWDLNKYSGGSGIAFRWHESPLFQGQTPPGNDPYRYYEGYGITFMIYQDDNYGSYDMIPNNLKPPGNSLNRTLLLVLWEQKVNASGVPTKDWLAYAQLGDPSGNYHNPATERHDPDADQKVTGYQVWPDGRLNDNATIVVRVEDKFVTTGGVTNRYNDIKVFYGDASQYTFQHDSRIQDAIAINKQRARYYPKWLETGEGGILPPINPKWPSNWFGLSGATIANWYNNPPPPAGTGTADSAYDYFSLTNTVPMSPYNSDGQAVVLVKNNSPRTGAGFSAVNLLPDKCTIRTTDFVLDSFPSGQKEIGLVGMGDISGVNLTVAFDDFYIQMLGGL